MNSSYFVAAGEMLDIEISMYIIGVARFIIKGIYITPWREEFQTLGISDGLFVRDSVCGSNDYI